MLGELRIKVASLVAGKDISLFGSTYEKPPKRGTRELLLVYSASPWLRAVVRKIGVGVAHTQWRLFVQNGGTKAVRNKRLQYAMGTHRDTAIERALNTAGLTEITDHPVLDLLYGGNNDLLGTGVLQTTQVHLDLIGEAFWLKERNAIGTPVKLWPIPPDWVRRLPTTSRPYYQISSNPGSTVVEVPPSEIVYFRDPDPSNPYGRGSGTGKALGDEVEIDEYASQHIKMFFYNRARPDIIVSGDSLSPEDTIRLEEKWNAKQKGIWNRFKPMFLNRKVDVTTLSQSFENMQMTDLRKQERDAFINVYGVPPEKLGVINESKRSTIAAADYFWTKDIINPRAEFLRNFIQWKLLPDFDDRLILHYDTPVVQDDEFQLQVMKASPWAYSLDEWRQFANQKPLKKTGRMHLVPLNQSLMDLTKGERTAPKAPKPPNNSQNQDNTGNNSGSSNNNSGNANNSGKGQDELSPELNPLRLTLELEDEVERMLPEIAEQISKRIAEKKGAA